MPLPFAGERGAETSVNNDGDQKTSEREATGRQGERRAHPAGLPPLFRRCASSQIPAAALLGLAAFVVYFRTLAVSIVWGDSPELTAAASNAGIPHPTGYPLYMMLAHAFMRLVPVGSIAYRMNLLAALSAGAAVALIYLLLRRVSGARWASGVTALAFAYSRTFWSQSVIAEHYPFALLGSAALLACVLAWDRRGERYWLFTAAIVYGLCLTHHMMSLLLAPGLLYFALTSRHRSLFLRELPRTLPLFLLPLSLYAYLPLAALRDPPTNWGDPRTWDRFLMHVSGCQYHQAMFHMTRAQLWGHVKDYTGLGLNGSAGFLRTQFGPGFFWLAPLGAWSLARRRWRLFVLTLLIYLADVIYALNYYIYNVEVYYLPSHLMVALWIACGLRQCGVWLGLLWRRLALPAAYRRALNGMLGATLLAMPVSLLWANWQINDHHKDWNALMYARAAVASLKPHAVLLAGGDDYYFPLMYTCFVEHRRPDVILLGFYDMIRPERLRLTTRYRCLGLMVRVPPSFGHGLPPGLKEDNRLIEAVVAENVDRRPVYVLGPPESLREPWLASVVASYYRVVASNVPAMELSRHAPRLAVSAPRPLRPRHIRFGLRRADGRVENDLVFLGDDLKAVRKGGVPWLRVSYYWRVYNQALARPARISVIFTDAAGNYQRKADGSPEFHNTHPLGYGAGLGTQPLPSTLRETFNIYVPPGQWNKRLHVRLAVALGVMYLPTSASRDSWIDLGEVPVTRAVARGDSGS